MQDAVRSAEQISELASGLIKELSISIEIMSRDSIVRWVVVSLACRYAMIARPEKGEAVTVAGDSPITVEYSYPHNDMATEFERSCLACGATVRDTVQEMHTDWHVKLFKAFLL